MNRRQFLHATALAGAALIVPAVAAQQIAPSPPAGAPGPGAVTADFAGQRFSEGGFAANFSFARGSAKTDLLPSSPPGARYRTFKPDEPAIIAGKGVLIEESREQFLVEPAKPASQSVTLAKPGIYTLWVNGSGRAAIAAATATIADGGTAAQGAPLIFRVVTAGTLRIIVTGKLNAFQLEKGRDGTSLIPAKGKRAADDMIPVGPLAALLSGASGVVVVSAVSEGATDAYANLVRIGGNALGADFFDGSISGSDDSGQQPRSASLGVGRLRDGVIALLAWTPRNRKLAANGGTLSRGPALRVINSGGLQIGGSGKDYWNGFIRRVEAFADIPTDRELRAMTMTAKPDIVVVGDSLAARNDGDGDALSFPAHLGTMLGRTVLNAALPGDTSTQIARRYASTPELWDLPLVIWAGRDNVQQGAKVQSDIAEMIAHNRSGKVVILSITSGQSAEEMPGSPRSAQRIALNDALAATYGAKFIDVNSVLLARYDPLNPVDRLDKSQDRVPYTLRVPNEGGSRYYLPSAIDAGQTAFETSTPVRPTFVMKVGQEYILVQKSKGTQVLDAVRGYGTGGTAVEHPALSSFSRTDPVHLSDQGRTLVARKVADKIKALGW